MYAYMSSPFFFLPVVIFYCNFVVLFIYEATSIMHLL